MPNSAKKTPKISATAYGLHVHLSIEEPGGKDELFVDGVLYCENEESAVAAGRAIVSMLSQMAQETHISESVEKEENQPLRIERTTARDA